MKTIGFIVTCYNIRPYIERCLTSLVACTRPGDTVVVIDDGSTDGTTERIRMWAEQAGFSDDVTLRTIFFGTNTIGGVGVAANVGLTEILTAQHCDAVFFVDGDDWLEPDAFRACRHTFDTSDADVLITNYTEYDDLSAHHRRPADADKWILVPRLDPENLTDARHLALSMIAVPWRKFYRADFLRHHGLRFPEGPFFFEDNPFHWAVCLKAARIAFHDLAICHHRINRPGQTMASTGSSLIAFFDHYETITALLPEGASDLEGLALGWLLNNMDWHVRRLQIEVFWPYAARAAQTLAIVPDPLWQATETKFAATEIGALASALRHGDVAGVVATLVQTKQNTAIKDLQEQVETLTVALREMGDELRMPLEKSAAQTAALHEIARYQALLSLPSPTGPPTKDTPLQRAKGATQ